MEVLPNQNGETQFGKVTSASVLGDHYNDNPTMSFGVIMISPGYFLRPLFFGYIQIFLGDKKKDKNSQATFLVDLSSLAMSMFFWIKLHVSPCFKCELPKKNGRLSLFWDGTAVSSRFQIELPGSVAKLRNVLVPRTW
jgi:hypothetical protein